MQQEIMEMEPANYYSDSLLFDLEFHPTGRFLASCSIEGHAIILKYDDEDTTQVFSEKVHPGSCRTVAFDPSGDRLLTGGEKGDIKVLGVDGKVLNEIGAAHNDPIYKTKWLNNNLIVSGDDNGLIKIWDLRSKQVVYDVFEQKGGTINGIEMNNSKSFMLATSTNGYLGVYDLRKENTSKTKLYALSDQMEEEYNDLSIVLDEQRVVCATSSGTLAIYNWDWFGNCKTRVHAGVEATECLAKLNEETIFSAGEDGWIREVNLRDMKSRTFQRHAEDLEEATEIMSISISGCQNFMASLGLDMSINFYDLRDLPAWKDEDEDFSDDEGVHIQSKYKDIDTFRKHDPNRHRKMADKANRIDFFGDL